MQLHFSFGVHEPEDLGHLAKAILKEAHTYFRQPTRATNFYFKEGAANPESRITAQRRAFRDGASLFTAQLGEWAQDRSVREEVRAELARFERAPDTLVDDPEDVRRLYHLDSRLGGNLYAGAQMYFLERLRGSTRFELDGERYAEAIQPARLQAELASRRLEIQAAEEANRGDVDEALHAFAHMVERLVENQTYRDATILNLLAEHREREARSSRPVRVFARLGRGHVELAEEASRLFGPDVSITHSIDAGGGASLPVRVLEEKLRRGEVLSRHDLVASLSASLMESVLSSRGVCRVHRRAWIVGVLGTVAVADLETMIASAAGSLAQAISDLLGDAPPDTP